MRSLRFHVIVIGGGHAGVEAAWAAANLLPAAGTPTVALVTIDPTKIGVMSCNPAIGGLAKGQLVREIDALGGLMPLATDATGIQFRVLNTSKGAAVHGPRAQCDKHAYAETVQAMIASRPEIQVIAGAVTRIIVEHGRCAGVEAHSRVFKAENCQRRNGDGTRSNRGNNAEGNDANPSRVDWSAFALSRFDHVTLSAPAVVLTTGTFMRGLMHTGELKTPGGRFGEPPATGISDALRELGFELGRLKTGTPPRLKRESIAWDRLVEQKGDETPMPFSELSSIVIRHSASGIRTSAAVQHSAAMTSATNGEYRVPNADLGSPNAVPSLARFPVLPQVSCFQTSTTAAAHELIRANLHRAPMYSGQIESVGPRYCPSIEDKVVRFAQRETHGVFLEPESLRDDWIYCNGISTSLPADVQDAIVRHMPGCARAEILRYGYAVEYDMVRPHQIEVTGQTKLVRGLFLAGQINGTSGYEEAAAQGLVAGVNAARLARAESEFVLGRDEAYIGVLMDDLVTKTPVEPYRMFTSRAEHRLLLRADNAADRLTPVAERIGLLANSELGRLRRDAFARRREHIAALRSAIDAARVDGVPLSKRIRGDAFGLDDVRDALRADAEPALRAIPRSVWVSVLADRQYEAYIARERAEIRRHAEMEHRRIPPGIDFESLGNLRTEAKHSLARFRPATFGQAARLEGITPADITLLSVLVRRWLDARSPGRESPAV